MVYESKDNIYSTVHSCLKLRIYIDSIKLID